MDSAHTGPDRTGGAFGVHVYDHAPSEDFAGERPAEQAPQLSDRPRRTRVSDRPGGIQGRRPGRSAHPREVPEVRVRSTGAGGCLAPGPTAASRFPGVRRTRAGTAHRERRVPRRRPPPLTGRWTRHLPPAGPAQPPAPGVPVGRARPVTGCPRSSVARGPHPSRPICSTTSSASVTRTAPPSRTSRCTPADATEVTGPGTPITSRWQRSAQLAVLSAPLRSAASTTTVPRVSAAIRRLRMRNRGRRGVDPGGTSLITSPASAIQPRRRSCALG